MKAFQMSILSVVFVTLLGSVSMASTVMKKDRIPNLSVKIETVDGKALPFADVFLWWEGRSVPRFPPYIGPVDDLPIEVDVGLHQIQRASISLSNLQGEALFDGETVENEILRGADRGNPSKGKYFFRIYQFYVLTCKAKKNYAWTPERLGVGFRADDLGLVTVDGKVMEKLVARPGDGAPDYKEKKEFKFKLEEMKRFATGEKQLKIVFPFTYESFVSKIRDQYSKNCEGDILPTQAGSAERLTGEKDPEKALETFRTFIEKLLQ